MLKFLKNNKHTNALALGALALSIFASAFVIADAYVNRTTTLASALQSVGLCPTPIDSTDTAVALPSQKPAI